MTAGKGDHAMDDFQRACLRDAERELGKVVQCLALAGDANLYTLAEQLLLDVHNTERKSRFCPKCGELHLFTDDKCKGTTP